MAHTPGPWKVFVSHMYTFEVITDDHRGAIICDFDRHNKVNNADNARLIAAAPELLEACQNLLGMMTEGRINNPTERLELAKAAIAKAKGE